MIDSFKGDYQFLSNFFPSRVEWDSRSYSTVEHAYQAAKTVIPAEIELVRNCPTPGKAKRAGQEVTVREDWDDIKLIVMETLIRRKFTWNEHCKTMLLDTGDQKIVEGNTWGDRFWGVCKGIGENHLGKILMKVRLELQEY